VPPFSNEPVRAASTARPLTSNETGQGAAIVQPLVSNETGQVPPMWIPPQEGNAAPVADAPAGPLFDRSQTGMRGAGPAGNEHGANYGGYVATGFNTSQVDDSEAASRAEYIYQQRHVQRQASRTPAMGTCTAVHAPTPKVRFGRPSTVERGRASPCTPSKESRASWRGWNVISRPQLLRQRRRPRPIRRRSTRVSFNCFTFTQLLKFASVFRYFTFRDI
jgi:hypothetical protein